MECAFGCAFDFKADNLVQCGSQKPNILQYAEIQFD